MAEERKFLFEVSFDEPKPQAQAEEEAPEDEPEVEVAPTFSEDDLNAARDEAFAKGKAEGVAEAAEATEQAILNVLEQAETHFTELFEAEEEAQSAVTEDAIVVAVGIVRKIFPSLNERQAQAEMERMVRTAMERILEDPKVIIYVAPELVEPLYARLERLATQAAYKGEVEVIAHADIAKGDCRVEWTGGGATRITDELWKEIDEIVERNLSKGDDEHEHLIEEPDAVAELAEAADADATAPEAAEATEAADTEADADTKAEADTAAEAAVEVEADAETSADGAEAAETAAEVETPEDPAAATAPEEASEESPADGAEAAETAAEIETPEAPAEATAPEETSEETAPDDAVKAADEIIEDAETAEQAVDALAEAAADAIDDTIDDTIDTGDIDITDDSDTDDAPDAPGDDTDPDREQP